MPNSEIDYPGASTSNAFVAFEPYILNIQNTQFKVELWGASRTFNFSGNVPFVNSKTNEGDAQFQAWNPGLALFTPNTPGPYNLNEYWMTNVGFPGHIEKRTINGIPVNMVKYNANDGIVEGKCRTTLNTFPVPPRTHVKWNLEMAFGNADVENNWVLTPSGSSSVLFWELRSDNQNNPTLAATVDTDATDPTKLMLTFLRKTGSDSLPIQLGQVHGILRNTMIPITIDAFLDERTVTEGGKGLVQIWVNRILITDQSGPTLAKGPQPHHWSMHPI